MEMEDRISTLPEPILHRILGFSNLKTGAKTSVLSKAWRYLWCSQPRLVFYNDDTLLIDRILQGYRDRNLLLQDFSLFMSKGADAAPLLNKWIPILIHDMCVQNFDLINLITRREHLQLPSSMLESDHIRSLYLLRCTLRSTTTALNLKRLERLCLYNVYVPEQIMDNILSNCPFIRSVHLLDCKGFTRIKLLNYKLTNLMRFYFFGDDTKHVSIELGNEIQTLRAIELNRCVFSVSNNNNKPLQFAHLTRLIITEVQLSDLFSCNLHCLEEMKLDRCSGIKEFKLSSRSMKRLDINNIGRAFKVTIDAPSMVSFVYEGILPQSISFAGADDLRESKIVLGSSPNEPSHCFKELYSLLKPLSQSEISLKLDQIDIHRFGRQLDIGATNDNIVCVSEAYKPLPVAVEHLTIEMSERNVHSSAAPFLNTLFRMFRPSFIYMSIVDMLINPNNEHREIAELLFKEKETTTQSYFWQRVLEAVSLQVLYPNQSEWQPVECTSYTELSKKWTQLRIQLKWRE